MDAISTGTNRRQDSIVFRAEKVLAGLLRRPWVTGGACLFILCGFGVAGLWPFRQFPNQITWIESRQGVKFGKYGIILSSGALPADGASACSVEIWIQPAGDGDSNTLLDFFGAGSGEGIAFQRATRDLRIKRKTGGGRPDWRNIPDVLQEGKPALLTVVLTSRGTAAYLDGVRAHELPHFHATANDCVGKLAVGHAATGHTHWEGEIRGLAIYKRELTSAQVLANYQSWLARGRPDTVASGIPATLYLFNEGIGNVIRDHGKTGLDLTIPKHYQDIERTWLGSPYLAFQATWGYVEDVLVNIGGFIPFGFMFSAFLVSLGGIRGATLWAVFSGFIVSLTIETLQAYLPTRDSDLTDVIFNTLGASVGAGLYLIWSYRLAKASSCERRAYRPFHSAPGEIAYEPGAPGGRRNK